MKVEGVIRPSLVLTWILIAGRSWAADGWQVSLLGGWTAPTYEERLSYQPDLRFPEIAGATFRQTGEFGLNARGSFAFGGSVAYYFRDFVAIEGRIDTVDFAIDTEAPSFTADVPLPAPLPDATAVLDLGTGSVDVERLFPFSLNVKARTEGAVHFMASGGISYLPRLRLTALQSARLSVGAFGFELVEPATVAVQAEALPNEQGRGRLGYNAGAGVEIELSDRFSLVADARFFRFGTETLTWSRASEPVSQLEELVLEELENELESIAFEPTYFQVFGGLAFGF